MEILHQKHHFHIFFDVRLTLNKNPFDILQVFSPSFNTVLFFFPTYLLYFCHDMNRKERYGIVLEHFRKEMPEVNTELEFGSIFQLLVAVVLSAQCTDKRINQVTPELFRRYPTATEMAKAEQEDVLEYIKSVSYPNAKSKHLVEMARALTRGKTANVIQSVAFGKSAMAVDTHVFRVSHRLGLVSAKDDTPYKVEQTLIKNIPAEDIPKAHHWLLLHGRYVCTSRKPHCDRCDLENVCPKMIENSKL